MSETILKVEDLKTSFMTSSGEVQAVRGVSFEVHKGEILGIVGESGSGKSVTSMSILRLLADTARIKNGKIEFEGTDLTKVSDKQMREIRGQKIAMVFQDPMSSLNPLIPVGKQVAEMIHVHHPEMKRDELQAATLELFREVRIPEAEKRLKSYPHEFSGGQRQRIGIARTLALNPQFIVCDEPISALDVSIQAQVINLLEHIQKEMGISYLFIAHDLSMVKHISDRIGVMYLGNLVEIGDSDDVYHRPLHPYTQALLSAVPIPDPRVAREKKRIVLEGELPSPLDTPSGCVFRTRCPNATERCAREKPGMVNVGKRTVACFLYEK